MRDDSRQDTIPASSIALGMPEILLVIGDRYYLTVEKTPCKWSNNTEKIVSLCAFIQVSKLWYRVFHPILWHTYIPYIMSHFSELSRLTNAPCSRIVDVYGELQEKLNCTQLVILELQKSYTFRKILDLPIERELVRNNSGLKSLVWEGPQSSAFIELNTDDFAKHEYLQELVLYRWDNKNKPFIEVLRPMANTLRILDLRHVKNFSVGNLVSADNPTHVRVVLPRLETILIDSYRYEFTRGVTPSIMQELVIASPNLVSLSLKLHQVDHAHAAIALAACLREHCPKLRELTVHCIHNQLGIETTTADVATEFIFGCSASGLKKISVWDAPWYYGTLFNAIAYHAATLENLELSWALDDHTEVLTVDDAIYILHLLLQCYQLKRIMITDVPFDFLEGAFKLWQIQQWGCTGLEEFVIHFEWSGDEEDDDTDLSSEPDDDKDLGNEPDDDEISMMSNTRPVMGWYLHGDDSIRPSHSGTIKSLFRMTQGKEHIKTLVVDKFVFTRSTAPPAYQPSRTTRQ
ncbi:hypothetical protein FBU30_004899 [Linnemannia zychae]|nr:hypothetical protein FBU30_004899 [Linnemannia zychae]